MDIIVKVDVIITVIIVALPRFDLFFPGGPVSDSETSVENYREL